MRSVEPASRAQSARFASSCASDTIQTFDPCSASSARRSRCDDHCSTVANADARFSTCISTGCATVVPLGDGLLGWLRAIARRADVLSDMACSSQRGSDETFWLHPCSEDRWPISQWRSLFRRSCTEGARVARETQHWSCAKCPLGREFGLLRPREASAVPHEPFEVGEGLVGCAGAAADVASAVPTS